jgi:hypothetical protein
MKYAQIKKGKVNIIEVPSKKVADDLISNGVELVDISRLKDKPQQGWSYNGSKFIEPETKPEEVKKQPVDVSKMTDAERWAMVFEKLGIETL